MKVIWGTDFHLNRLSEKRLNDFSDYLNSFHADSLFITGDISNGLNIVSHLDYLSRKYRGKIYFILGNHDFYLSNFDNVKKETNKLCEKRDNLFYLDYIEDVDLGNKVGVVGKNGWFDVRWMNPLSNLVFSIDFNLIQDFRKLKSTKDKISFSRDFAYEQSIDLNSKLKKCVSKYDTIYILTHFPPWPEGLVTKNKLMEKFWIPFNTNRYFSEVIKSVAFDNPKKKFIVLSGHTHISKKTHISENIELMVGGSKFMNPYIEDIFYEYD